METQEKLDLQQLILEHSKEGTITCANAFRLVREYGFFPDIIGIALNNNKIKIKECQLGLFGYTDGKKVKPAETISEEAENKIYFLCEDDDRLPCMAVWNIANELKVSKLEVACYCEKLNVKISKCQLGAFK